MTEEQKHAIGKALGRVPSGIYILTAKNGDHVAAMMASWVQQASFSPPCLSIAVAKNRPIADLIRGSGRLALSIVPDQDKSLMKHYARMKPGDDPLAGVSSRAAPSGLPILTDALAFLDCRLLDVHEFGGDHDLFIAQITDAQLLREGNAFAHQRGNGFHY